MATIEERTNNKGVISFRARVRTATIKASRTFNDRRSASIWAGVMESHAQIEEKNATRKTGPVIPLKQCGVYFLLRRGVIVYIGSSLNVMSRIFQHTKTKKDFDSYQVIECMAEQILDLEKQLIHEHAPIYNVKSNQKSAGKS